jgi:ELWxxDGT repeat protein
MKRLLSACALVALAAGGLAVPASASDFDATPHLLKDATPGTGKSFVDNALVLGNRMLYAYQSEANGTELWVTDGTSAGTRMVKDIVPGPDSSNPDDLTLYKGKVYFRATDAAHGNELWVTDGTTTGTKLYRDVVPGPEWSYATDNEMVVAGSFLYFVGYTPNAEDGAQIWKTDGIPAHTTVVQVIKNAANQSNVYNLTRWGNRLAFSAKDSSGQEPWVTDGTTTSQLKDIVPAGDSNPNHFAVLGSRLMFVAGPSTSAGRIWVSSFPSGVGPPSTTELAPSATFSFPGDLIANGATLYFTADGAGLGTELYKSDGTAAGTVLAKDINPTPGEGALFGDDMVLFKGAVYFQAADVQGNAELWRASSAGVAKVRDLNGTSGSYPSGFCVVGSLLFFGAKTAATGFELFVTDGTSAGTKLVKDAEPGPADSYSVPLAGIGSTVFFDAETKKTNDEVWAYTTKASTTKGYPKAKYTKKAAKKKLIRVVVKVRAARTTPTGRVYLKQGTKVVGVGVLKYGNASIRITKKWGKGVHNVRAFYTGSLNAQLSNSTPIHIKVK